MDVQPNQRLSSSKRMENREIERSRDDLAGRVPDNSGSQLRGGPGIDPGGRNLVLRKHHRPENHGQRPHKQAVSRESLGALTKRCITELPHAAVPRAQIAGTSHGGKGSHAEAVKWLGRRPGRRGKEIRRSIFGRVRWFRRAGAEGREDQSGKWAREGFGSFDRANWWDQIDDSAGESGSRI